MNMVFHQVFSLYITTMAVYGIIICFRYSLPCYIIENLSTLLDDVEQCFNSATAIGAIPAEHRADLETLVGDLARMRIESHRSPGFFQQIELGFRRGLTHRLYLLSSRIKAVKMKVELAMDERRLASLTPPQIVVSAPLPGPPDDIVRPMNYGTPPPTFLVN